MSDELLAIYLNDHLMGATGGLELFRRAARNQRQRTWAPLLRQLTGQVDECRRELLAIMSSVGAPRRTYKVVGGWLGEKAGRAKLNGRLWTHSPLSDLVELELLVLGAQGQAAMWRALLSISADDDRLNPEQLESLLTRAQSIAAQLEDVRLQAAAVALSATER